MSVFSDLIDELSQDQSAFPQADAAPVARDGMGEVMESDENYLVVPSKIMGGKFHPLKRRWPDGTEKTDEELEADRERFDNRLLSDAKMQYNAEGTGFEPIPQKSKGDYSKGEAAAVGFVDGATDTVGLVGRGTVNLLGKAGLISKRQVRDTNDIIRGGLASGAINALSDVGSSGNQGFNRDELIDQNTGTYIGANLAGALGEGLVTLPVAAGGVAKGGQLLSKAGGAVSATGKANTAGRMIQNTGKLLETAGKFRMVENAPKIKIASDAGFLAKNAAKAVNSGSKVLAGGLENVIQGAPITASRAALEYAHGAPDAGKAVVDQTMLDLAAPLAFRALGKPIKGAYKIAKGKKTGEVDSSPFTVGSK